MGVDVFKSANVYFTWIEVSASLLTEPLFEQFHFQVGISGRSMGVYGS
jgi:hypothetical protein